MSPARTVWVRNSPRGCRSGARRRRAGWRGRARARPGTCRRASTCTPRARALRPSSMRSATCWSICACSARSDSRARGVRRGDREHDLPLLGRAAELAVALERLGLLAVARGERVAPRRRRARGAGWSSEASLPAGRLRPPGAQPPSTSASGPPREQRPPPRSPEVLLLEDVQVLDEVVERHLGVDLAAVGGERPHERGVALAAHREGGDVAVLLDLGQQALLPSPVGIGQDRGCAGRGSC